MAHSRSARRLRKRRLIVETLDARLVLATVSGIIFEDLDLSTSRSTDEAGLADRLIYADLNDNARVDFGEPIVKSDADGRYALPDLSSGEVAIRLFNGSQSQRQTSPWTILRDSATVPATEARLVTELNAGGFFFVDGAGQAIRVLADGTRTTVPLQGTASHAVALPDGRVLVAFAPGSGDNAAAIVDFSTQAVEQVELAAAGGSPVRELAIAAEGRGLMIVGDDTSRTLVALDASGASIASRVVEQNITASSRLIAGGLNTPRIGIVQPTSDGVRFLTWNTVTESINLDLSGDLPGVASVDAFAGDRALLVTSRGDGTRAVRDARASFLSVGDLSHTAGPVAFDQARNVVFAVSASGNDLVSFEILSGASHAYPNAIPADGAGVRQVIFSAAEQRVVLATAVGIERLLASAPAGHRLTLAKTDSLAGIDFGVQRLGQNTSPTGGTSAGFEVAEDGVLTIPTSGFFGSASDADGDSFIAMAAADPDHGSVVIGPDGGAVYVPARDYAGPDTLRVVLHDGASASAVFTVAVAVTPQDDAPTGLQTELVPIGERAAAGTVVGQIQIADPDQDDAYVVTSGDPRFEVVNGSIVRSDAGDLNFESATSVPVRFTGVAQNDPLQKVEQVVSVNVADENDPVTGINVPDVINIPENTLPGVPIVNITVVDEDPGDTHVVEVFDNRFEIVDGALVLAPGTVFDFEDAQPDIILEFVARETHGKGDPFAKQATVKITDANDAPSGVALTTGSVLEHSPGYQIAPITIEDQDVDDTHTFTIDDERFEVVDGKLKLKDGEVVTRDFAPLEDLVTITINITVTDSGNPPMSTSSNVELVVTPNPRPYHNEKNPGDVNGDGKVMSDDALAIINELNANGPGVLIGHYPLGSYLVDVNGDNFITPIDVLIIINRLNQQALPPGGSPDTPPPGYPDSGTGNAESVAGDPAGALPSGEGEALPESSPDGSSAAPRLASRDSDEALPEVIESFDSERLRVGFVDLSTVERRQTPSEIDSALDLLECEPDSKVDEKSLNDFLLG